MKPAHVLFAADWTAKLTDFGLAKLLDDDPGVTRDTTRTGGPVGTPRCMAPEQAAGQADRVGPPADVHALGTLLDECLSGRAPFVAAGALATIDKIRSEDSVPPRRLQRSVPRDLETVCLHCLEKQPGKWLDSPRSGNNFRAPPKELAGSCPRSVLDSSRSSLGSSNHQNAARVGGPFDSPPCLRASAFTAAISRTPRVGVRCSLES